jgi:hypothetical protein
VPGDTFLAEVVCLATSNHRESEKGYSRKPAQPRSYWPRFYRTVPPPIGPVTSGVHRASGDADSRKLREAKGMKGGPRLSSRFWPRPSPSKEEKMGGVWPIFYTIYVLVYPVPSSAKQHLKALSLLQASLPSFTEIAEKGASRKPGFR